MSELGALIAIEEQAVPEFLVDGPNAAIVTIVLAHGAGAPMDSPFLTFFAEGLAAQGHRVVRFEFPYMAAQRREGNRRPPDRPNVLLDTWQSVIDRLGAERLVIGGKSLGGRMASMIADAAGVQGLVCLGYPFHPPGQLEKLRIAHLRSLSTTALILQGSRDPFGTREEVVRLPLSPAIRFHFLEDGDHGFAPRAASGRTERQNWQQALDELARFLAQV
jgi:predicted alpha/beta-hydrolase family hydrolase